MASKANVADLPSRNALSEMADALRHLDPGFDLEERAVPLVMPACPSDLSSLWEAVMAQFPAEPNPGSSSSGPTRRRKRGGHHSFGARRVRAPAAPPSGVFPY